MKRVVVLGAVALVATSCGSTKTVTKTVTRTVTVSAGAKTGVGPPGEQVQYGYIRSLTKKGAAYQLRFDPAWFLSGVAANNAAAQDGKVSPGQPVPNDNYVVNDSPRAFVYNVPANARVTVLATSPQSTPITVAQLADILSGKQPLGHALWEPISTGFWMRIRVDAVRSLDQQYHP